MDAYLRYLVIETTCVGMFLIGVVVLGFAGIALLGLSMRQAPVLDVDGADAVAERLAP